MKVETQLEKGDKVCIMYSHVQAVQNCLGTFCCFVFLQCLDLVMHYIDVHVHVHMCVHRKCVYSTLV